MSRDLGEKTAEEDVLNPRLKQKSKKLKHLDLFYHQPAYVKREEEKPEDCIPDLPENKQAREFLANAPTKGLWMPLGKEVKVMQCWRCKEYGHRSGDRECQLSRIGNTQNEQFRMAHEDPMYHVLRKKFDEQDEERSQKELRIAQMKAMLEDSSSSDGEKKSKKKKKKKKGRRSHHDEGDERKCNPELDHRSRKISDRRDRDNEKRRTCDDQKLEREKSRELERRKSDIRDDGRKTERERSREKRKSEVRDRRKETEREKSEERRKSDGRDDRKEREQSKEGKRKKRRLHPSDSD